MGSMLDRKPGESEKAWRGRVNRYHQKWREANREKTREATRRYRERHGETLTARRKQLYIEHHEEKLAYQRDWQNRNRDRVRGYSRKFEATQPKRKTATATAREVTNAVQRRWYAENLEAERERNREKSQRRVASGLCRSCKLPAAFGTQVCETHWFAQRATQRLGLGPNTVGRGQQLKTVLEKQHYRCPYTGKKLVPGVNASVDHIVPVSRNAKLRGKLDNIEWVDEQVNRMKQDLSRDEFLNLIQEILEYTHGERAFT